MKRLATLNFAFLILLTPCFNSLANKVEVKYILDGKQHIYASQRTQVGYVFNQGAKKKVKLATLDWPPYIGEKLCDKGWVFQAAVALLTSQGYQVTIQFFPWARAVKEVETGNVDILFPEYFIEESAPSDVFSGKKRRDLLVLSSKFPGGEIGFMKLRSTDIKFNGNLDDLVGESIGVVRGYQNTPEFDAMMDLGLFKIIEAVDDFQLMKILAAERVNLIIGDPLVLVFSVKQSDLSPRDKQAILDKTEPLDPMILYHPLYFALSNSTNQWPILLHDLNGAIAKFSALGILKKMQNREVQICQQ